MTKTTARLVLLGVATFPAGAIATIITGDLRALGVGIVLAISAVTAGRVALEAARLKAKAEAAQEAKIKADARKFLDDLAAGRFHGAGE
jgi:hypothetical protein